MENMNFYHKHYITVDELGRITDGFSDAFRAPSETDICINEQGGYQFRLFPGGEENPALREWQHMIPLYKYENSVTVKRTEEEIAADVAALPEPDPIDTARAVKEDELSRACNAAIVAGMDVETSVGTEHFSLQETDQINLTTATNAVQNGASAYPYHADGSLCRLFAAGEILAVAQAATSHKLYHTTLCNHLLTWTRRAGTVEEIEGIAYDAGLLPADLAENMANIFTAVAVKV